MVKNTWQVGYTYNGKKDISDKLLQLHQGGGMSRKEADQNSNLNNAAKLPTLATSTGTANMAAGTSIFDPVLCELIYTWFNVPNGKILDPFAGGSVRGIVANYLGFKYTGIDLRFEQIEANIEQAKEIIPVNMPNWVCGNSLNVDNLVSENEFDLIFSCPPYYDLEIYSDNKNDLSNYKTYEEFLKDYKIIIEKSIAKLKNNRFTCFVVGDVRDKKGFYHNFVSDTIECFEVAGAKLYNEAILVTSVGSLPIRITKQFQSGRKLGKTHQNILIFYKGDPKQIKIEFGDVSINDNFDE